MPGSNVTEIAENIYRIRLPMPFGLDHINVYLLKETNQLALVDCGLDLPDSWQALDDGLAELGLTPGQLTDIFVTHGHPDHIGQLPRLRQLAPNARLYMHRREYQPLADRVTDRDGNAHRMQSWLTRNGVPANSAGRLYETGQSAAPRLQPGDRLLEGGEVLSLGENVPATDWQIIWTPGHTAGHFVLHNPARQLLLSGDHLLGSISSNIGKYPGSTDDPLGDFIKSLENIARLDLREILPAHGETFANHRERIQDLIAHHQQRLGKIYASLEGGPRTASQVVETIWGDRATGFHRFLALVEALSHLERLRLEGRVVTEEQNATVFYRAA